MIRYLSRVVPRGPVEADELAELIAWLEKETR